MFAITPVRTVTSLLSLLSRHDGVEEIQHDGYLSSKISASYSLSRRRIDA
jgi:hypothetical protein